MNEMNPLKDTYDQSKHQLGGHGTRDIHVLQEAFQHMDGQLNSDMYGKGQIIEDFQMKMATFLGKETSVFFPSGTMAQQVALRIWCDESGLRKVAYHPLCHLEIHEEDGLKKLHQIETVLLADKSRLITLDDIKNMEEGVACVVLELPQREIGGQLPSLEVLEQISEYCRDKAIKLHLDGARLLEALPYYHKSAAEVSALFDSVYISLYKGIGGIAGAILAGNQDFTARSKVWKRRHGGDLISLYPYIIPANYYFDQRSNKMGQYYEEARELAKLFNNCHGVCTLPTIPVSNMFHVHFHLSIEKVVSVLSEVQQATGIGITRHLKAIDEQTCYCEISLGDQYAELPCEDVTTVFLLIDKRMRQEN